MELNEVLQIEINKIYGMEAGKQSGKVLIPAFINDFRKVLDSKDAGAKVSEEYMTEDKKMHLILTGCRRFGPMGVEKIVTSCKSNGKELLSEEIGI